MSEISGFDWRARSKQIARLCLLSVGGAGALGRGPTSRCWGSDPLSYALEIDAGLRSLLGFTESLPAWRPSSRLEQGRLEQLRDKAAAVIRLFFPIKSMPRSPTSID